MGTHLFESPCTSAYWKTLFKTDQLENAIVLRLSINAHRKQSFFVFHGLHRS